MSTKTRNPNTVSTHNAETNAATDKKPPSKAISKEKNGASEGQMSKADVLTLKAWQLTYENRHKFVK